MFPYSTCMCFKPKDVKRQGWVCFAAGSQVSTGHRFRRREGSKGHLNRRCFHVALYVVLYAVLYSSWHVSCFFIVIIMIYIVIRCAFVIIYLVYLVFLYLPPLLIFLISPYVYPYFIGIYTYIYYHTYYIRIHIFVQNRMILVHLLPSMAPSLRKCRTQKPYFVGTSMHIYYQHVTYSSIIGVYPYTYCRTWHSHTEKYHTRIPGTFTQAGSLLPSTWT